MRPDAIVLAIRKSLLLMSKRTEGQDSGCNCATELSREQTAFPYLLVVLTRCFRSAQVLLWSIHGSGSVSQAKFRGSGVQSSTRIVWDHPTDAHGKRLIGSDITVKFQAVQDLRVTFAIGDGDVARAIIRTLDTDDEGRAPPADYAPREMHRLEAEGKSTFLSSSCKSLKR